MDQVIVGQLESLRERFSQWRVQKSYPNESIPEELWRETTYLAQFFPPARIAVALKISIASLNKKIASHLAEKSPIPKNTSNAPAPRKAPSCRKESVQVTRVDLPRPQRAAHSSITVHHPDGFRLEIPIDCPVPIASQIINVFVGGQQAC